MSRNEDQTRVNGHLGSSSTQKYPFRWSENLREARLRRLDSMAHEIGTSVLDGRPLESPIALPSRLGYAHQLGRRSEVQRNASASKRSKCRGNQQHPIASALLAPRRRGSNHAVASGFDFACESTLPGWNPCGIVIVMICPGMVKLNVEPGFDAEEGLEAVPSSTAHKPAQPCAAVTADGPCE